MLSGLVISALLAAPVVQQQPSVQRRDTTRLDTISVRESARSSHRYSAPWLASALKVSTPLRDTPASVAVLTSAFIREQSMQSMADAVRYVPGVSMGQGEGHRDAPTIRGNSSTADFFVDGIRDDAQYYRDFYNVERVEALTGSNAMTFGRGGGGGVINRVTKQAQWERSSEYSIEGGSHEHTRGTVDRGGLVGANAAFRVNSMYQKSSGFRDAFGLTRFGVSPSAALRLGHRTTLRLNGEYFEDERRVDRGMPSFQGRPAPAPLQVFFGNPDSSRAELQVGTAGATLEQQLGDRASLRTHVRLTAYDKFYQNVLPGAVSGGGTQVTLSGYSNDTQRENYFAQSEATLGFPAIAMPQTLLIGAEIGRQDTDNFRQTGYFNDATTSVTVPFEAPTVTTPVTFRQSATDANNNTIANVVSMYAQDQLWLTAKLQATVGVRLDRFALDFTDHRSATRLARTDNLFSPRAGLVFKPVAPVSLYGSYGIAHLPASGDQFSGLTPTTQTLEPERFANREVGAKWEVRRDLLVAVAGYELLRTNSAAPSALDPGVIVQTGKQRSRGAELSLSGSVTQHWDVMGALAYQRARIVSRTSAAPEGATVPLVPERTFSLWNRYRLTPLLAVGAGAISQSRMFAAIDNSVVLPGFWRFDAALFLGAIGNVSAQLNVENVLNQRYFATSHGNNNIMPGAPRTVRVSVIVR
jgi:catecholate siderophore receptor